MYLNFFLNTWISTNTASDSSNSITVKNNKNFQNINYKDWRLFVWQKKKLRLYKKFLFSAEYLRLNLISISKNWNNASNHVRIDIFEKCNCFKQNLLRHFLVKINKNDLFPFRSWALGHDYLHLFARANHMWKRKCPPKNVMLFFFSKFFNHFRL